MLQCLLPRIQVGNGVLSCVLQWVSVLYRLIFAIELSVGTDIGHTFVSHDLLFSPSVSPPTMASADFSQFVVTTANEPPARPHGISPEPFPVYSPDLRIKVTVAFWDFDVFGHLIRLIRLTIRFLSVEPRFRYYFFSPTPHDVNLASRYRVRWQLRPLGLSPKVRDMPVIPKNAETPINRLFPHFSHNGEECLPSEAMEI